MSDSSMDIWSKCHSNASISIVGYSIFFLRNLIKTHTLLVVIIALEKLHQTDNISLLQLIIYECIIVANNFLA